VFSDAAGGVHSTLVLWLSFVLTSVGPSPSVSGVL